MKYHSIKMMPSLMLIVLLLLIRHSSAETSEYRTRFLSSTLKSTRTEAEFTLSEINLFPEDDISIAADKCKENSSRIVEKRLKFSPLGDSGATVEDLTHHVGYYRLPHTKDARLFYYFFESRKNNKDPVLIWLSGGPGCGSEIALFYENGPFHVANNLSLVWNDFGWDKESNIIFLDQPTGTGFSYSSDVDDLRRDENTISSDLYDFLQAFFKEHPKYINNDFYITGESYAGHYIPAFATKISQGNKNKEGIHINLKGMAIGNGLTNPEIQFKVLPDYALSMNLINQSEYDAILSPLTSKCVQAVKLCGTDGIDSCARAYNACISIYQQIIALNPGLNYYDIRKKCYVVRQCYDFSAMLTFLDQEQVRQALGVGTIPYVRCSNLVFNALIPDWMRNLEVGIPALLEDGIRLLIYVGEYDLAFPWLGNLRWMEAMEWSGQENFLAAPTVPFTVEGAEAGLKKSRGPLTFLKVYNAGHLVPMDQPQVALKMLQRWLQGNL